MCLPKKRIGICEIESFRYRLNTPIITPNVTAYIIANATQKNMFLACLIGKKAWFRHALYIYRQLHVYSFKYVLKSKETRDMFSVSYMFLIKGVSRLEKQYTVAEVADKLNRAISTIRKWIDDFDIKTTKIDNKVILTEKDFTVLEQINNLKNQDWKTTQIKKFLARSEVAIEQEAAALEKMPLEQMSYQDLSNQIANAIAEREKEMLGQFQVQLENMEERITEQVTQRIQEQITAENQKLLGYIEQKREVQKKKSFWQRLRGK